MAQLRKRLPRANVSSHGRGHGFESRIAHHEKPLFSRGLFASGQTKSCDLLSVHGRGHPSDDAYYLQRLKS